jgi:hypothetical protein
MRASTAGAVGRLRMRVWRSLNADGTSATEITSGTQVGATVTLSTTTDQNTSISWSPGSITLIEEYLFFQLEWQETTAGSSSTSNVLFRIGTASITTPDFTASSVVIWNPQDKFSSITLSNGNLSATSSSLDKSVRASHTRTTGYFELFINTSASTPGPGLGNSSMLLTSYPGASTTGIAYYNDGTVYYNNAALASGLSTYTTGDTIGVQLTSTPSIIFYKNGSVVYTSSTVPTGALYPVCDPQTGLVTANFGATSMSYLPSGVTSWDGTRTGGAGAVLDFRRTLSMLGTRIGSRQARYTI